MRDISVVLVSMPWQSPRSPSIQLGTLKAVLDRHRIPGACKSYFLAFLDYLAGLSPEHRLSFEEYEAVADYNGVGLGDWIFAVPPFRQPDFRRDSAYLDYARQQQVPASLIQRALQLRGAAPAFLQHCLTEILALRPRIVGFTSMFSQNVASLGLAALLKQRAPQLKVVFGGANCQAQMGAALLRNYRFLDAVVRGEAEQLFPQLVRAWLEDRPLPDSPDLLTRSTIAKAANGSAASALVPMDEVPLPDYDEYFERLEGHRQRDEIEPQVAVPIESARGCWWGAKSHCTFCGLNGATMRFRSKRPQRVFDEIMTLARRHRRLKFFAVDNILDLNYFQELLPKLRDARLDLHLFYEMKANLKKNQLRLMREAGLRDIQPGIESFSNAVLKLMRKGTTGLQNIRLLKWCAQFGIDPWWNLLYGIPGEPPEEYQRQAWVMRTLSHLKPPQLIRLCIDRFSPYQTAPEQHGLRIVGPVRSYQHIYDLSPAELADLAYTFEAEYADGRDPETYIGECRSVIRQWNEMWPGSFGSLLYRRGPGFLTIVDRRPNFPQTERTLDEREAQVYLACDGGASPAGIRQSLDSAQLRGSGTLRWIESLLEELAAGGYMYSEEGRYLSLALRANTNELIAGLSASDEESYSAEQAAPASREGAKASPITERLRLRVIANG